MTPERLLEHAEAVRVAAAKHDESKEGPAAAAARRRALIDQLASRQATAV